MLTQGFAYNQSSIEAHMCTRNHSRLCVEPDIGKISVSVHRYKSRLYADLGLNLWIVKMCQPLPVIEAQAASYATGLLNVAYASHNVHTHGFYTCVHCTTACITPVQVRQAVLQLL